jgi:two-component system heavy metal sensor histidine kinase CusS
VRLLAEGDARVAGDRSMVRRALANLLSNAIRHSPPGGDIRLEVSMAAGMARIAVTNPGAEIPAEALPRLFDRFYTGDPARRNRGEGAGLGLAITRSIARMHGGDVEVRSAQGRTTFTLSLKRDSTPDPAGIATRG